MTSDFTDIATIATVRKCLGRQVEEKNIRRIMDGVYEKTVYSNLLKEYIPENLAMLKRIAFNMLKKETSLLDTRFQIK